MKEKTEFEDLEISEAKREYLIMLQEPISRLSTASSVFKGFAATIVTGIAALSYNDISLSLLIISFIPIIAFFALDIYYLRLEKRYRGLYQDVLIGKHCVDYSLKLPKDHDSIVDAKATIFHCIISPSIWLFYPAMFSVLIIVCILKGCGGV